jgi:hypothetical protein
MRQPPVNRNDGFFPIERLGIDYREIKLEFERQIRECLPEIPEKKLQQARAISRLGLAHFLFGQTVTKQHDGSGPANRAGSMLTSH